MREREGREGGSERERERERERMPAISIISRLVSAQLRARLFVERARRENAFYWCLMK